MATFNVASKTYTAGAHVVGPFVMPNGLTTITISFTVAAPDINDTSLTLDCVFECQNPNTLSWDLVAEFQGWTGGIISRATGQPIQPSLLVNDVDNIAGMQCRITATPNKSITTAISLVTS